MQVIVHEGTTCIGECRWEDERRVFVKRLREEFRDDMRYLNAFRKEYEIGSSLDCPYLARYVRMDDYSIVEEFIDGVTLDVFLQQSPDFFCSEANVQKMLLQLLDGVGYLHERQILHLDLKPANLMVSRMGNTLKIVDLGFAYTDTFISSPGGTRDFAAPEQMKGDADLNVTTDIYAIGRILLYINNVCKLPKRYLVIAAKCCRENPEERYQSVREIKGVLTENKKGGVVMTAVAALVLAVVLAVGVYCAGRTEDAVFYVEGIRYKVMTDSTLRVVRPHDVNGKELDLVIPEKVTYHGRTYAVTCIDSLAYDSCPKMISLTMPPSIDSIGDRAFAMCNNITNVYLPNGISHIGRDAFRACDGLRAVRLPEGIVCLERGVFSLCDGLEEIDVPANVKVLKQDGFGLCRNLRTVHLHEGLEVIERGVFWECQSLQTLTIPSTVREIGNYAFWGCSSLTDIYVMNPEPPRITDIFKGLHLRIHVPKSSEQSYRNALFWKEQDIIAE